MPSLSSSVVSLVSQVGSPTAGGTPYNATTALLTVVLTFVLGSSGGYAQSNSEQNLLGEEGGERSCPNTTADASGDAKRLTLLGVSCFKQERFSQAYTFYSRAYEVDRSDLLRAAMGRSLHELGIYGPARSYYESFLEGRRGSEDARKIEKRLAQLRDDIDSDATTAHLTSFPSGADVYVELSNGEWVNVGETPARVSLASGRYTFKYDRSDYRPRTKTASIRGNSDRVRVDTELYHVDSEFDLRGHRLKKSGMYTLFASIPVLVGGGVLFGLSADKFAEAEDYTYEADYVPAEQNRMIETGHRFQQWAIGLSAVGAGTLITGSILFFRGRTLESREQSDETEAAVRPILSPRVVGIRARF